MSTVTTSTRWHLLCGTAGTLVVVLAYVALPMRGPAPGLFFYEAGLQPAWIAPLGSIGVISLLLGYVRPGSLIFTAASVYAGGCLAYLGLLLWIGPGNLWPVALGIAGIALLAPVLMGTGAGWLLGRRRERVWSSSRDQGGRETGSHDR